MHILQRNVKKCSKQVKVTTTLLLNKGLSMADTVDDSGKDFSTIYLHTSFYSISVMNQLLNLQTDHQTHWGRTAKSVVYLLIKCLNYRKKLIIVYTLITSKFLNPHSLIGVLLIKEWLIHSIVLALLTNKLRMFLVRPVVKNRENCSNNLTRYLNKPLIMNQLLILLMVLIRRVMLKFFKLLTHTKTSGLPR